MNNSVTNNGLSVTYRDKLIGKKLHFIGIGGASMSGLSLLSLRFSPYISGSDKVYSDRLRRLQEAGIDVYVGSNIDKVNNANLVIYSSAIKEDDMELKYARDMGIPTLERSEYLAILSSFAQKIVAIAGSHGKSTTSAILGNILDKASAKATLHIGADMVDDIPRYQGDDIFVTEACEYRKSFLRLQPTISVVLNIDYDHPDEYPSYGEIVKAFDDFMDNGKLVISHESVGRGITYGYASSNDYIIENVVEVDGKYDFDIQHGGKRCHISSPLYGKYNIDNIVASYVIADVLGIDDEYIISGILEFSGLKRRCEVIGYTKNGAKVITDYAHHPREIESIISTAHLMTHGKVVVVFEPHTYSRTRSLIDGFMKCFYWADHLILLPTYSAREVESDGYSTLNLLSCLRNVGEYPLYFDSYKRASEYLTSEYTAHDIILVLGAGSVDMLAHMIVGE